MIEGALTPSVSYRQKYLKMFQLLREKTHAEVYCANNVT